MFASKSGASVYAIAAGTVAAVSPLSEGRFGLLIDHGSGVESLYAGLSEAVVRQGDPVSRGQKLGTGTENLYFEYRENGDSIDPSERLGLD